MKAVGAYEAKTHLLKLLDEVAAGEMITITKHGVPVARLVPPEVESERPVAELIEELREFRRTHKLGDVSIRELIDEGRHYWCRSSLTRASSSPGRSMTNRNLPVRSASSCSRAIKRSSGRSGPLKLRTR